jgi:hypothetical protein
MAVSVLPENFFVDLIPTKVMELDTTGVLHATLSGFQDHSDDIRAYISYINKLIDPFAGHPIPGTCVATNYTDEFGLNVTRTVLSFDLESDKTYQSFEAGNLTQDEAKAWMGDVLAIDPSVISSVETVVDPFKTVYQPMIGYLANNIGAIFPTSNADDPRNADLVASHFSRLPIKGTSQSIETAGLLAGFDSVHVNPLWGRLSPRNPLDVGLDANNPDFSETTVVEPTIETTEFYDPLSYRDGPFYTWSTRLSLLNNTNFVSQANGANPYLKWKIDGLTVTNFRGVYTAASTYNSGDVVVSSTGRTFLVKASTTTAPPTSLLSVSFLMPAVDSSVLTTVTDSSWMSVGQLVTLYSAGTLEVAVIDGTSVTFINKGANGNLSPGITVNAGSVIVSQDSSIWLEITQPSAGIYTLSGGEPNVEATATLSSTISVEGLAEGVSFNGLEILVDSVPNVISTISTSDATPSIASVTTAQSHGLTSDSYIFISNVTPFDYVGLYSITVTSPTSFTYQLASNVYEAGTAADGIVPYYSNGDFEATIFDRLSSIKYRTSYYNLVLTIKEATINARSVPAKPNPSVIEQVGNGSLVASPPYLPFSGTTEVAGNTQQVDTLWLTSLAAETEVILNSVKPSTRYIRQFSTGVLYEDTFGYAEYANQALVYDKTSSLSGTITGPIYPRTATITIVRVPSDTQFFQVISFGDDSPTLSISPELVVTFNTVVGTEYQVESKDSLFAPWYPATPVFMATSSVTNYQLVPYETVVLTGQSSQGDPNQVTFSGTESYGVVSTDLDYYTGIFSAIRPAQFPSGNSVVANWLLTDSGTIRTEPTTAQKQAGTIGFLPRPEDQFGTLSQFGSRPTLYPDVNEWTRPLEHEILDRDLEPVYGNEEKFPGKFVASADSNNGLSYGVYLLQGTFPYRFRFTELSGQNPLPTIAYSGNNQYYVGIRYGQLLACPERTFSASMQSGLSAWIPFNAHPDEDLDINCVYPVIRQMTVTGLIPQDRVWDSNRGWVTYCHGLEASISIDPLLNEFTLAFWFKPNAYVSTQTILSMGPLVVKMASISTLNVYYSGVLQATLTVSSFSFISIRQKNATLVTGVNSTYTSYSVSPISVYTDTLDFLSVSTDAEYYLQDFKLWSTFKLSSDVTTFYQPSGVATQLATQPTPVEISTTGDRWFLRVLASGFVASDLQPQSNLVEVTGQFTSTSGGTTTVTSLGTITEYPGNLLPVANYDVQGRFIADSGRNLVGLAGGVLPTLPRRLGEAFLPTSAINRDPVSPNTGLPSGINPEWLADTSAGYVRIVSAPFSGTGGVVSTEATGTVSPWPNPANYTNPLVDRIWIEGDSGTIYQLGVGGYVSSPTFTVTPVPINALNEYPSGAVTVLTNGTTQLSVNSSDVVYSTGTTDTTTPITYLYRHEYGIKTFTGSEGWIPTESSTLYDGSPSLYSTGQLMWSSTASTANLDVGHYRLRVTAHNRGQVARTFEGFDVEVTIGQNITFPMVLSPNSTSEETYYDFYVNNVILSPWLIQIYWGGIVDDPTRGITYQLVVDGIEIDRLKTQVYRVGPGVSLVEVSTTASGTTSLGNLTPGGWLAEVTSTGTIYAWEHEANINPSVGGVEESYTLSELLTMSTDNKVSRVMLSPSYSGSTVLPNPSATSAPSISSHTQTLSPGTTPIQVGYGLGIDVVASGAVSYIWNFWDSSVETTDTGTIQKVVNQGGTLPWTCTVANEWGQSSQVSDSIIVNSPPVIQSATLSNNDLPPTYATALTGTISDPNSASPILVWLDGVTPTTISTLSHGTTQGTFNLPFSVATNATKILHAVDVNGGTTLLDIDVRALPFKPIIAAVISQPKSQRIGNNSTVRFTCRATDPNGGGTPTFAWDFLTAEGWVSSDFSSVTGFSSISGGYTSSGLTQNLSGGVYQNTVLLPSIANQTAGSRRAKLTITPTVGDPVVLYGSVTLIENHAPVIQRFDILSPDNIQSGVATTIQAIVTDEDNDILSYSWAMTNVSDPITNLNSNPIVVHPNGTLLTGTLTASDPYGSYDSMSIPAVLVSSKTAVDGTVGVSFTYRPYAMSPTTATFSWGEIPSGLTLINGTILGTPQIAGITATQLTATSASGTDVRDFTWRIYTAATPPLSPTNFIVNGDGNNPRYASGQTLTLQWTITNDGGTVPGSAVELRQFDGTLVKTIEVGSGINVLVLTSNDILSSFGSYQDIDIRVYALRNSTRSVFPAETIVTYTY